MTSSDPVAPAPPACCTPVDAGALSAADAVPLAHTLKALSDPTRLRLLSLVAAAPDQEACVCDLTEPVGLSQPTVSHHLKVLVDAQLMTRDKRGVWSYYSVVPGALDRVSGLLAAAARPGSRASDGS
ncbi:MAG TPA: metalloregulator ArsR/SmtB family transcription factor [Cellulomonadaceae bacterium]|nr:metalloregulator ArsR/SmtB family transcription factor [Cellulomonadaceae bacterium]